METELRVEDQGPTPAGRPRDPRIDRAVLSAAADLVRSTGYADVTMAAIAQRAGTTKPALYRRWPSKAHLVHEAVFPLGIATTLPDTGSLPTDLREMLRRTASVFSEPAARAALPGLLAEISSDPALHGRLLERFQDGVWTALSARLERAAADGEVRAGIDPVVLLETVAGAVLMALLIRDGDGLDDTWVDHTAELLTKGLLP